MLAIELAAILAALFVLGSCASVNYCGATMCGMSNAHTFCQYTEGPGPKCSSYIDDHLSSEEKARVLARLNRRRHEAAQGRLQLPPASNMLKLRWIEELAREAQIWADQCNPPSYPEEHDACRDLFSITVGQCVASVVGEAPGLRPESMVDMWYLQGRQSSISMYRTEDKKSSMDFAQMLWAYTYLVGCARSRFMVSIVKEVKIEQNGRLRTVTRLVCNFAPRGPEGPLWTPGVPASACPARSGPDPALPGLCVFYHNANYTHSIMNATVLKQQLALDTILEMERNDSLNFHGSLDQIYLTKMMMASMNNQTEQQHQADPTEKYVAVQAKTEDEEIIVSNVTDKNKNIVNDVIEKMLNETSTARVTKKIFSTVGRPKSYNIEELNNLKKDSENGTARSTFAKEDDAYNDYDLDDIVLRNDLDYMASITENNFTTAIASVQIENATETALALRRSAGSLNILSSTVADNSRYNDIKLNNTTVYPNVETETATPYVQSDILKRLLDLSEKTDQNPSDPETAQQLEEALEQMEKALASPPVFNKVKVRRETRSQPPEIIEDAPIQKKLPQEQSHAQKLKEIGTPDAAPIMAILTKYAPLIKSYENFFARSNASKTTLSLVVLLLWSFVSISL